MGGRFDVIVIGVGGMGAATCYHLARRGVHVLGLEESGIPNARGSSHGHARIIRMAYYEHPDYVPLLMRSYELWSELETAASQHLLTLTGGLYIGSPSSNLVSGSISSASAHNLPFEYFDHAQLSARFPQFQLPRNYVGMYEKRAGFVNPELAVASHARLALSYGAELHGCERVVDWSASASAVTVRTTHDSYTAARVVFCGGPWTTQLVRGFALPLVVTRQSTFWLSPKDISPYHQGVFPTWAIALEDESLYYGFPAMPERPGVKVAHHRRGVAVDPDSMNRQIDAAEVNAFLDGIGTFVPDLGGPVLSTDVCLYTNTPDGHFIIDRHPLHESVVFACGFSGHGFKFTPVVGEALADLACDGGTSLPIQFLGLSRFSHPRRDN